MQKTITIGGHKYNGKQIAKMFNKDNITNGEDYIVDVGGVRMYGNYRQEQDTYYAPVCDRRSATCIALYVPEWGHSYYDLWLKL
jgi:hypothetical protein